MTENIADPEEKAKCDAYIQECEEWEKQIKGDKYE